MTNTDPPWLQLALTQVGIKESSVGDNPKIVAYYADAGHPEVKHDAVAWCAAFVGSMLKRSGLKPSGSLLARSYLNWGVPIAYPTRGAVVVLSRGAGMGHVFFWLSPGTGVGGNQSDRVSIARFDPSRLLGYRWPAGVPMPKAGSLFRGREPVAPPPSLREPGEEWFDDKGETIMAAPAPNLYAEVPVVNANATPENWAGLTAAITPLVLWAAQHYGAPLDAQGVAAITGGVSIMVGLFIWFRNRYFNTQVTLQSMTAHGLKVIKGSSNGN